MDNIVDGAALLTAASKIDAAVLDLSLICERIEPLLIELGESKGLSSEDIDEKYSTLGQATSKLAADIDTLHKTASGLMSNYIAAVDQADRFLY